MTNLNFFIFLAFLIHFTHAENNCDCLPNLDDRIVNGERAGIHEFPWQLSLGLERNGLISHICGATLLNEEWVVTASHCVYGNESASKYSLGFGTNDLQLMNNRVPAEQIIINAEYDSKTPSSKGDIALIRLSQRLNLTSFVKPACLMKNLNKLNEILDKPETVLQASGWGSITRTYKWLLGSRLRGAMISRYLKKASFKALKEEEKNNDCKNRSDLICIKPITKGDSVCNGDSGGPLQFVLQDENSKMSVIGVTSFGSGSIKFPGYVEYCNGHGAYTKIAFFNSFITKHIDEKNLCMI